MAKYRFPSSAYAWTFKAGRFTVGLSVERDRGYRYDGDDEDGETQARLDSGEFVAFDSTVSIDLNGTIIAESMLCGSVYDADRVQEFWTDHRTCGPESRNTLANAAKGVCIGHYFPDMIREAISLAREHVRSQRPLPYIRESAR